MNLLTSLAVSDTSIAIKEATETRKGLEIDIILHVEACLPESMRRKMARGSIEISTTETNTFSCAKSCR
uniref:Uncharacterized protein n=1 Tax=Acrobeloides nanus TaxID=290746 RepID=A0A914E6J4_9BILA